MVLVSKISSIYSGSGPNQVSPFMHTFVELKYFYELFTSKPAQILVFAKFLKRQILILTKFEKPKLGIWSKLDLSKLSNFWF